MKIALLGTRGVPAHYSGFETCVEQLGKRLVDRGHDVTVYCRKHHVTCDESTYLGMRLVKMGTIQNKYLDTITHSFITSLHALGQRYDAAIYFIAGNSPVTWIPRLVGTPTLLNVDGLDWKRAKWPPLAKRYIRFAEYLATKLPTLYLTDSTVVQDYYEATYGSRPPYIPYGSEVELVPAGETVSRFGLEPQQYVLFVGRLVPENCAHHLIEAYRRLDTRKKLVIVGDAAYADEYISYLHQAAEGDDRIVFTGYVFGKGYHELGTNASIFCETSGVGGTHPALTEAMAHHNCVIVHDTPENLETVGDAGLSYDGSRGADALRETLAELLADEARVVDLQQQAAERAAQVYNWERVTDAYERFCYNLADQPLPARLAEEG